MILDEIDYKIMRCLKKNAREKASAISEEISLSVSAVIERIRQLETAGIITGYTAIFDQKQLGNDMTALMEVSLEHPRYYDDFCNLISSIDSIVTCYYMTGDYDFMLRIVTDSSDSLELIHRRIKSMEGVSATETHFVLRGVKNEYSVIPDNDKRNN